jgi:S1-C subfamily serine protease
VERSAQATGFVVDAERGLILTNRHVVTPGPVTAEATFLNREEVQLYPVYRDPVHDFGLYRYDPSKLRFIKPQALPLHPEGAQIGREIRVIGNNAGEQLSILRARSRASTARRPSTASASTTTSTPSTCRPPPAPRAAPPARRWSTSRGAWSR